MSESERLFQNAQDSAEYQQWCHAKDQHDTPMNDTPKTDALQEAFNDRNGMGVDDIVEAYDFARELERENARLTAENARLLAEMRRTY